MGGPPAPVKLDDLPELRAGKYRKRRQNWVRIEIAGLAFKIDILRPPGRRLPEFRCPECQRNVRVLRFYRKKMRCRQCLLDLGLHYRSESDDPTHSVVRGLRRMEARSPNKAVRAKRELQLRKWMAQERLMAIRDK